MRYYYVTIVINWHILLFELIQECPGLWNTGGCY